MPKKKAKKKPKNKQSKHRKPSSSANNSTSERVSSGDEFPISAGESSGVNEQAIDSVEVDENLNLEQNDDKASVDENLNPKQNDDKASVDESLNLKQNDDKATVDENLNLKQNDDKDRSDIEEPEKKPSPIHADGKEIFEDQEEPKEEKEKKNFTFLQRLLTNVGADVLRRYFRNIHPNWTDDVNSLTSFHKGALMLKQHEKQLFQTGDTKKWDVSLLINVLRFTKISSQRLIVHPKDDAALKNIRQVRNEIISHGPDAMLEDSVFATNWILLKDSLIFLGATEDEVDSAKYDYTKLIAEQYASELEDKLHLQIRNEQRERSSKEKRCQVDIETGESNPLTWNSWQEFIGFVKDFKPERSHFILLVDKMSEDDLENFKTLSYIPWSIVLDFDPASEENGFHKSCTSLGSFQRLLSPWTPGQIADIPNALLPKCIERQRTQWLFVNGRNEDTEGSQPKEFSKWEQFSKKAISRFFSCCSEEDKLDNQKPITCIISQVNKDSGAYVDVTFRRLRENFDKFKISFCCFDKSICEELSISEEISEFPLTSKQVKQGIESIFHSTGDIPTYRMPTSQAGIPLNLNPREFAYYGEHLQLLYDGCENETFDIDNDEQREKVEEQHRRSFLSGNLISTASLHFNHDAKRDIEDEIQAYVLNMLSQRPSRSSIVSIRHSPGTGGSTIARRVLWNLRKSFPCVVVKFPTLSDYDESDITFIRKVCDRISELEEDCGVPVLVLVDSFSRSVDILGSTHRIARNLNTLGKKSVILECLYTHKESKSNPFESPSYKVFTVASCLEDSPADLQRFKSIYKEFTGTTGTAKRVFHFPLLSMIKEFRPRLEEIVFSTLNKLDETEREVVALVAFVHMYAGQSTPAILIYDAFKLRFNINAEPSDPVTYDNIKEKFSDDLLNLMVHQNPRKRVDSPSQCFEMYTLQHIEVSKLVFQEHLSFKKQSILMYVNEFLELKVPRLDRFLTLYSDLLLYYKSGNRDLKFSSLFTELDKINEAETGKTFCKAAKVVNDPRIYAHAARYYAKMRKQNIDKAKELLQIGFKICKSKRREQGIKDTLGIVLFIELKTKIRKNMIGTLDDLQQCAEKAVNVYREARDFPPTFHSPLIGEVEVWLSCIGWIIKNCCENDAEKGIRFIHSAAPSFFRTCIGDCFTLLDRVDEIIRTSENIHDPEKAQEHSRKVRYDLIHTTTLKSNSTQSIRRRVEDLCKVLLSAKKLPPSSEKQVKRYRLWTLLSLFRDQQLDKPEDLRYFLRLLEEMVFIEKDYAFARHLLRICPQVNGREGYDEDKAMKVCMQWLKAEEYDPSPYFYCMAIAFIQIINGHGPSGYFSIYHDMVNKLREKTQYHCRRTDATHYLGNGKGMSQLVSRASFFMGKSYQTDSDSEVVGHFWKKESREKLRECAGRIRVSTQGKNKITKVELLQGGNVQLYVKKNASLGIPGKDFDKDAKVYFVVSFNLTGAVANGITFEPFNAQ